ncbi:MASE3 domain-containing protein [Clostridium sp.]|uniref:sensor histidine kinase n=1 Tax=Clostridium sp. TaxID=1506 RepID=UPI0026337EE4|nr:MASE3 domain-containing protein [Clostridium sp.]
MLNLSIKQKQIIEYTFLALLCFSLYFLSRLNFSLFHTSTKLVTIVLGFSLMLIGLGTIKMSKNNYFHILAIIFGLAAFIDLLHVLNLFNNDFNLSIQLSVLSDYYKCIMLSLSIRYISKEFNWYKVFLLNILIIVFAIVCMVVLDIFPVCYVEGYGFTLFRKISELICSLFLLVILFRVINSEIDTLKKNRLELVLAICLQTLSYVCFVLYNNIFGIFGLVGNILNILAYYYGFKVVFKSIVVNPYTILFQRLNHKVIELEKINKELNKVNYKAHNMEKLNEKFINLIPDGILIIRDKKIKSANNRFLNMFSIDNEEKIINMNCSEIIDKPYRDIFEFRMSKMNRSILEKPHQYEIVWGQIRKWVEITSLIVNDESGEYIISAIRNIEDRKKAEQAVQLLELKKKEDIMKNEFFTNISHELRTPINVIYSALQVENSYFNNDNTMQPIIKYNKIIRQNCLRLIRLVNNIIDITRIETSFFKPNYSIENIVSIVEEITMSIVEYIESKHINLIFDTEIEEAYVKCDAVLIERIILNLLSNAVKYGKNNGNIKVYICQDKENKISIFVKDDGIGIPNEMREKIFDRFLKIDNSLSRKTEGSGIGLSIVKQLVEIHGGTITFSSELNFGTEFKITLPIVDYCIEACATTEKTSSYHKNIIESAEIEFSDIYD